jgi:hypothetical protein
MRGGITAVVAVVALLGTSPAGSVTLGDDVGPAEALSARAFKQRMSHNPQLRDYVALRGYPDWVEEVEVYNNPPLDAYEVRAYYLRLDREVAFTRAFILGRPDIGLRLSERPIAPDKREEIRQVLLARNPALRAELAAERAMAAADSAEQAVASVEATVARVERLADEMERDFDRTLYK